MCGIAGVLYVDLEAADSEPKSQLVRRCISAPETGRTSHRGPLNLDLRVRVCLDGLVSGRCNP